VTRDQIATLLREPPRWLKRDISLMLSGQVDLSDDIIHDAVQKVLENSWKLRRASVPQIHKFLKKTAKHLAIDHLRDPYVKRTERPSPAKETGEEHIRDEDWYTRDTRYKQNRTGLYHPWEVNDLVMDVKKAKARLSGITLGIRIADLYGEGWTLPEIAWELNIPRSTLYRLWRDRIAPRLRMALKDYGDSLRFMLRRERERSYSLEGR